MLAFSLAVFLSLRQAAGSQIILTPIGSTVETPSNELFVLSFKMRFDEADAGFFSLSFYWDNNESDPEASYWNFTFISYTCRFVDGSEFTSPLNFTLKKEEPSGFPDGYYRYTVSISEIYGEETNGDFWLNVTMFAAGINSGAYKPHAQGNQNITIVKLRCYEYTLSEVGPGNCSINVTEQVNFHDIAVLEVVPNSTLLYYGETLYANVTVRNNGTAPENFNVTIFLNETILKTSTVTSLSAGSNTTLTFSCSTLGLETGNYTLRAKASTVLGETNIVNNVLIDGEIQILGGHDIAVVNVTTSKNVVCQGFCVRINVTIENQGNFPETFNVTIKASGTPIAIESVFLENGTLTVLNIVWNTTGFAKGNYTITATADAVQGEIDVADNAFTDGWIVVSMVGDVTGPDGWPDGKVNMRDIGAIARCFGTQAGDPEYEANYDIVYDGKINMRDVGLAARHFGETDP